MRWRIPLCGFCLGAGVLLLAAAYYNSWLNQPEHELKRAVSRLQNGLQQVTATMDARYPHDLQVVASGDWQQQHLLLSDYSRLPFSLLAFRGDSLIFWTGAQNVPLLPQPVGEGELYKLRNGWFVVRDKWGAPAGSSDTALWLRYVLPLRYEFVDGNRFLSDHWNAYWNIPSYIGLHFADNGTGQGHEIRFFGRTVRLVAEPPHEGSRPGWWGWVAFVLAIFFFTAAITGPLQALLSANRYGAGLLVMAGYMAAAALYLNTSRWLPDDIQYWRLFQPELFASPGIAATLGAFFILLALLVWAAALISFHVRYRFRFSSKSVTSYVAQTAVLVLLFLLIACCAYLIKTLVDDSNIQFAFFNPLNPDWYSIAGVLCIAMLLIALHLIGSKLLLLIGWDKRIGLEGLLLLLLAALMVLPLLQWLKLGFSEAYVVGWSIGYVILAPWLLLSLRKRLDLTHLNLIALVLVASGAALLYRYGEKKEKELRTTYARMLVRERDAVTEYLLTELRSHIENDHFLSESFSFPVLNAGAITQRLMRRYLSEGFARYDISVYAYQQNGDLLFYEPQPGRLMTERGLLAEVQPTADPDLFFAPASTGGAHYIARYRITTADSATARLYAVLRIRELQLTRLYPVLLLPDKDRLPDVNPQYSFAVYRNGVLQAAQGEYAYEYRLWWDVGNRQEPYFSDRLGYNHLVMASGNQQVVVVSRESKPVGYYLSYFSFLFLALFFLSSLVLVFRLVVLEARDRGMNRILDHAPLRTTIQLSFVVFLAPLLVALSYVTGRFALNEFNQLIMLTVSEKMERIGNAAGQLLQQTDAEQLTVAEQLQRVKDHLDEYEAVHASDLNLFDASGALLATTQPAIFERGILARIMNPEAFLLLTRESKASLVQEEQIGRLKTFSGYYAIRTGSGNPVGFINLPYYNSRQNINEEVGFFFVMLVNILVVALIVSGLLAPLLSRQIMQRLQIIRDKLQKVKLGAANEPIDWPAHDEIGDLVREYNKMIKELERSAEQLARTARESAWREMAKQVAHEIKNPLTPMRLSVQHLQRAVVNKDPQVNELTQKVCRTLIEQIDTLSAIASEFSDFAKMPEPVFEAVDVNAVLQSAASLHRDQETADLLVHAHAPRSIVVADRQQLLRVFSNLILNAIQAIPPQRAGRIDLTTQNQDNSIVVTVTDNGIGIDPADANRVFVPNFTTKSSGAGLGLAISKGIVESIGGTISFRSEPGVGTTFFVRLPLATAQEVHSRGHLTEEVKP
ncbi:MAG: ATP-binding protein [Chitinophagales bacterium]|nr:ATP-binding protein [Chitinophagales bacterium]